MQMASPGFRLIGQLLLCMAHGTRGDADVRRLHGDVVLMEKPRFARPDGAVLPSASVSGTPKPLLLYLPGLDGSGGGGAIQWPRLSVSFEIWNLIIPPHDRSSFDALCAQTEAFLREQHAGDGRPALLVGESSGAVLALGVALREPDLVYGLCIVNPATGYHRSPILPKLASVIPHLPSALYDNVPGFFAPLLGKPGWLPPLLPDGSTPPARTRQPSARFHGVIKRSFGALVVSTAVRLESGSRGAARRGSVRFGSAAPICRRSRGARHSSA